MPSSYLAPGLVGVEDLRKGGRAVVAMRRFATGSVLAVWGGDVVTLAELLRRPISDRRLTLQVDEDAFLVSTTEGPADWINHSCDPNAGLRGQITLVAMRDIEPGEEICFDYAMADGAVYDEFECRCGVRCCRGRVTGSDWTRLELMERYAGFLSPYLQRRVDQMASAREEAAPRRGPEGPRPRRRAQGGRRRADPHDGADARRGVEGVEGERPWRS